MTDPESPIFRSDAEDPEMEQAAALARKTFRYFWRELAWEQRRIIPGLDLAAVKGAFSDPPGGPAAEPGEFAVEHMWMLDVEFDGRRVTGTLINSPHSLKSVSEGDRVCIKGKQVFDWMYVQAGQVYGGFTVDVLRSRMSRGERRQHDAAWGLEFGEPGNVMIVPSDYLGEAPKQKSGFLAGLRGAKPEPQDISLVARFEHPMSVNMRDSLDQALRENPEFGRQADEQGFTCLHDLALAGSVDGVEICLKHGLDPQRRANNGLTPLDLAKSLGWKRVMALLQ